MAKQHYIWFIKLPLDEQGKVMAAARQQFLQIVVEALGWQLDKNHHAEHQLPDNPFTFVPAQQLIADFNSSSRCALGLPPSQHFALAYQYVQNPHVVDWQKLSVQGIADTLAFAHQDNIEHVLTSNFGQFANEVQIAFCHSFENHSLSPECTQMLINWWRQSPQTAANLHALLRALSQSESTELRTQFVQHLLEGNNKLNQDDFILLAARHWQTLQNQLLLRLFAEKLADLDINLFCALFRDLVQLPDLRDTMLAILRWPEKTTNLSHAIALLFNEQTV